MYLEKIKIKNFKKIINLETELNKNINIFIGNNAQGKTSILESIYVLALTKPSKSVEESELINKTSDFSLIKGNLRCEKNQKEMEVILTNQEKILKQWYALRVSTRKCSGRCLIFSKLLPNMTWG